MAFAAAPARPSIDTPAGNFYARVEGIHTGPFSSSVTCLFLEVLCGSVSRGDPVEILRGDGTTLIHPAHELRHGFGIESVLDLEKPHPPKRDLEGATVARTPGLATPQLAADDTGADDRLLAAVRATRAQGFPPAWATPIRPLGEPKPEAVSELLRSLPDEAVVLLIQKRVRDSTAPHDNPFAIMRDVERAAVLLDAVGLRDDGDRLLLTVAAAVQGHKASTALRAAASAGGAAVVSAEQISRSALEIGQRAGWAIGIEMGETFAKAFASNVKAGGEVIEATLLEAGRAAGVGWCKHCKDVMQLRYGKSGLTGSPQHRCPTCDHKVDEPLLVVPSDAADVQQALRGQLR